MGGTFNLSSLCTCPNPCADCCISVGCCSNRLPGTLYADVNQTTPACAVTTITLTWDGATYWKGSGTITCGGVCAGAQLVYLRLSCVAVGPIFQFRLGVSCDNFTNENTYQPPTTTQCNPLQLTFSGTTPALGCATCASDALAITVYE